jgi:sulfide:quinone oxidoreductase
MIHVVPPQQAPDFIRSSDLVDVNGWLDVNKETLQHKYYLNIYALGDVINTFDTKTAVAARKQALVVATNILFQLKRIRKRAEYDGSGSRPLTVKNGKIILADYGYADNCYIDFLDGSSNINYSCN